MKWADVTSRLLMGIFIALNVLMMYVLHIILKRILKAYYQSDLNGIKVLVIGKSESLEHQIRTFLDNLDMQKAISDMRKDQVLQGYQYFVGSSRNLFTGQTSEDGVVILKNNL